MNYTTEAKLTALYFAIEGLQNRLDNDITDRKEQQAYQREIARLITQQQKLRQKQEVGA